MSNAVTQKNIHKFIEFINSADENIANEIVSHDAIFKTPIRDEPFCGPKGYVELLLHLRKSFADIQWTLDDCIIDGDKCACQFTARGTHTGEFMGIPATNRHIEYSAMNFYYFKDNKLINEVAMPNIFSLLMQICEIQIKAKV